MTGDDQLAANGLLGYSSCSGCPSVHPTLLLQRLGGRCWACIEAKLGELEPVEVQLGRYRAPVRAKKLVRAGRGRRETAKLAEKARLRALKRLRGVFPDLYEAFLVEERRNLGLEPVPIAPSTAVIDQDGLDVAIGTAKRLSGADSA